MVAKTLKWFFLVGGILLAILIIIGFLASFGDELLKDAFVAPDVSLKSATVKYVTKEGQEVSIPAYAGQIEILTSAETDLEKVKEFISGRGGKIIAQAPAVGIYIAEVSDGKEAKLIEALLKENWVVDAYPYTLLEKNQAEYIFDFWNDPSRERSHGAAVCHYAMGQKECTKEILDNCFARKGCQEAEWPMFYQILREIKAGEDESFITINLSLGPKAKDKNGKTLPASAVEALYRAYFSTLIQILGNDDLTGVKKTIIINSAGNEGADLTPVFQALSSRKGFLRLIVAGAVTPAGEIASYSNYSKGERDIVYSVGGEKAISMAGKNITWTGTSFAAPQITCLLNNWLIESPGRAVNPQELRDSVFDGDSGKDAGRDFQYRYRIDPCLTQEPAEGLKEEPKPEKSPSPSGISPGVKVTPTDALNFSVPERLPSGKVGLYYSNSFNYELDELLEKYGFGVGCSGESCGGLDLTINLSGGKPPYRFSVVGKLPDGMRLDSSIGYLTGLPTNEGEYQFQICATDNLGVKACKDTSLIVEAADTAITYANKAWEKWGACMTKELGLERFAQLLNDPDSQTQEEADTFLACFADFTFEELYNQIFTSSQRACVVQEIGNTRVQALIADSDAATSEEALKTFQCGELISVSSVTEPPEEETVPPPAPAPAPAPTSPPTAVTPEVQISSAQCVIKIPRPGGASGYELRVSGTATGDQLNFHVYDPDFFGDLSCSNWAPNGSDSCKRPTDGSISTSWSFVGAADLYSDYGPDVYADAYLSNGTKTRKVLGVTCPQ